MGVFLKQAEAIKKELEKHGSPKKFSKAVQQEVEAELSQAVRKSRTDNEDKVSLWVLTLASEAHH